MGAYTAEDLTEALRAIDSVILERVDARKRSPEKTSHLTHVNNRLHAMRIAKNLITEKLFSSKQAAAARENDDRSDPAQLLSHADLLHTTKMGAERIRRNLQLDVNDPVAWCRESVLSADAKISRKGKNWYIGIDGCIITAHRS